MLSRLGLLSLFVGAAADCCQKLVIVSAPNHGNVGYPPGNILGTYEPSGSLQDSRGLG